MRLFVGAVVCIAMANILSVRLAAANPAAPSIAHKPKVADLKQVDWLSIEHKSLPSANDPSDPRLPEHRVTEPVLLPLPAEAWASIALLASMACFRGLKRARVI
ncbi:hypothetical protein BH10PLA1_BH10PLA1_12140 [soil metagenome]